MGYFNGKCVRSRSQTSDYKECLLIPGVIIVSAYSVQRIVNIHSGEARPRITHSDPTDTRPGEPNRCPCSGRIGQGGTAATIGGAPVCIPAAAKGDAWIGLLD